MLENTEERGRVQYYDDIQMITEEPIIKLLIHVFI